MWSEIAEMYYITLASAGGAEPKAPPPEELEKWAYPKEILFKEDAMKRSSMPPEQYTDDMLRGDLCKDTLIWSDMLEMICAAIVRHVRNREGGNHYRRITGICPRSLVMWVRTDDGCGVGAVFQSFGAEQIYNVAKQVDKRSWYPVPLWELYRGIS